MKARDRIALSSQRLGWHLSQHNDSRDRYERDGYTIDVTYTYGGAICNAILYSQSWSSRRALRRDGLVCDKVLMWMAKPTDFIKPPAATEGKS